MRTSVLLTALVMSLSPMAALAGDLPDRAEAIEPAVVQYWQGDPSDRVPYGRMAPRAERRSWGDGYARRRYGGDGRFAGSARRPDCCAPRWRGYAWSYPRDLRHYDYRRDRADWALAPVPRHYWRDPYRGSSHWRTYAGGWRDPRW